MARNPSPSALTSRPPCAAITSRAGDHARGDRVGILSPSSDRIRVEPTMSVNMMVAVAAAGPAQPPRQRPADPAPTLDPAPGWRAPGARARAKGAGRARCRGHHRLPVDGERIALPSCPVEGQHESAAQPLTEGVACHQGLELRYQLAVTPGEEIRLDAVLERRRVQRLQRRDLAPARTARARRGERGPRHSASAVRRRAAA